MPRLLASSPGSVSVCAALRAGQSSARPRGAAGIPGPGRSRRALVEQSTCLPVSRVLSRISTDPGRSRLTSFVAAYRERKRPRGRSEGTRPGVYTPLVSGPMRAVIVLLVWTLSAVILNWGRLSLPWRRRLSLAFSGAGLAFLFLALNTGGLRESASTGAFLIGTPYVTGTVSASASLPYYVMTGLCLLLGTTGLALPESSVATFEKALAAARDRTLPGDERAAARARAGRGAARVDVGRRRHPARTAGRGVLRAVGARRARLVGAHRRLAPRVRPGGARRHRPALRAGDEPAPRLALRSLRHRRSP